MKRHQIKVLVYYDRVIENMLCKFYDIIASKIL
jgi:hypothetical protein